MMQRSIRCLVSEISKREFSITEYKTSKNHCKNHCLKPIAMNNSILPCGSRWRNKVVQSNWAHEKEGTRGKLNFPLAWSTCKKLTTEICRFAIWFSEDFFALPSFVSLKSSAVMFEETNDVVRLEIGEKVNFNWIAIQFAFNSQLETSVQKNPSLFALLLCDN